MRTGTASLIVLLLWGVALPSAAAPQGKAAKVTADATQRRYQRKAALAASDLGLQSAAVQLPLKFCKKAGKKLKCVPVKGGWKFPIHAAVEAMVSKEIFDWLVTQRLDKLLLTGNRVSIRGARSMTTKTVPRIGVFRFGVGSYDDFKATAEKWSRGRVSKLVHAILAKGVAARYQELPEQERGTFLRTRARQLGVPAAIVEKLMNSAYAFFVYLQTPKGTATIVQGTRKIIRNGKTITIPSYSASIGLETAVRAVIHHYSEQERSFVKYDELTGESGTSVSASKSFPSRPSREQAIPVFMESLLMSIRAAGINLNTRLKYDDNFAIFFTADSVDGGAVAADVGVLEDIRVDAPGIVMRHVDGEVVKMGFMKARSVSVNCGPRTPSTFALVSGSTELGDQVREHPWTGLFLTGDVGMTSYELTKWGGAEAQGGGAFVSVLAGLKVDLGYVMNKHWLSEVWLDLGGGLGFGGEGFSSREGATPWLMKFDLGVRKRLYLGSSGVYAAPGLGLGLLAMAATDEDVTDSVSSFVLTPGLRVGYNISPNIELTATAGWGVPVSESGKRTVGENDPREITGVDVSGGLQAGVMLSFHSPVVGPVARLYSKPSLVCSGFDEALAGKKKKGSRTRVTRRPKRRHGTSRTRAASASAATRAARRQRRHRQPTRPPPAKKPPAAVAPPPRPLRVEAKAREDTGQGIAPAPRADEARIARLLADADAIQAERARDRAASMRDASPQTVSAPASGGQTWKWVLGSLLLAGGGTVGYLGMTGTEEANSAVSAGKYKGDYRLYEAEHGDAMTLYYIGAGAAGLGLVTYLWAIVGGGDPDEAAVRGPWRPVAAIDGRHGWHIGALFDW